MVEESSGPRYQLHVYISKEARDGWYEFSATHGTNVTALLEAVGMVLGEHAKTPEPKLPSWLRQAVSKARSIASSRRSRRRT